MTAPEPMVLAALQGRVEHAHKWPGTRTVKIFLSSVYNDFREERRLILEVVGPELQSTYDDRNIECLLGGDLARYMPALPRCIEEPLFDDIVNKCESLEKDCIFLRENYKLGDNKYHLYDDQRWYNNLVERTEQRRHLEDIQNNFTSLILDILDMEGVDTATYTTLLRSPIEIQCELALELVKCDGDTTGMIVLFQDDAREGADARLVNLTKDRLAQLRNQIEETLPEDNIIYLETVSTQSSSADPYSESELGERRHAPLREGVQRAVAAQVDRSLSAEPDQGKARKKTVQEVFLEHITHLKICIEHTEKFKLSSQPILEIADKIVNYMIKNYMEQTKHAPTVVYGPDASGKTSLLTYLYDKSLTSFPKPVLRIIRFSAATPRSAYNLELLRVMCQQISIILNIPEGYLPKDASFDPLYMNNWFQSLLRRCEEFDNEVLIIFIDNIHRVNPLECDIVSGLSWLPIILPKNVFFICTSAMPLDQLLLTPAQKEKFKNTSSYHLLDAIEEHKENKSYGGYIERQFDKLENIFGVYAFSKLAGYITCSEFGLTEIELLELLMPTANSDAVIQLSDGNFNFSSLCVAKELMETVLLYKWQSGRWSWCWRAASAGVRARRRYVREQGTLRDAHSDLAALYFAHFVDDEEPEEEEEPSEAVEPGGTEDEEAVLDSTPFHSASRTAAAFTQRHVEESWLHLLLAGDFVKLKDLTVCNFDFLLAAVQTVTISYLRCILEHVRCYILDRDVELVYGAVRRSSDILTRDPMQLGAQMIAWLRPAVARRGVLATLVTAAMAWCDGYDKPLLVPLNGWLQPPIAVSVRALTACGARLLQLAPSGQHLVLAPPHGDPQLWHVMSNTKVHTFKGHSGAILCMTVTQESQFLVTGSEDTTVIVWDLHTLAVKLKIAEHIAPVLCVAAAVTRSLVISGGEDSAIIVASLVDGTLVTKLDHHRGPVTGVKIIQEGEVLVSCSQDGTVCSWATDSFALFNTIGCGPHAPVHSMQLSDDSVFLLTLQGDNELHLRTFITGTELHTLKRHKAKVTCFCMARDSRRAAVGCTDQRVYVYALHSGALLRALPVAHELSALTIAGDDHFLLTAGGNRVTIYSFHTEDGLTNFRATKQRKLRQTKSTTTLSILQAEQSELIPISCLEVSRDGLLAASGCARGLVRVWQLPAHRLAGTLAAHAAPVTCVTFTPNNLLALSGSEDRTVVVWQLADHSPALTYRGHTSALQALVAMADSRRAVSADRCRTVHVWLTDSGIVLHHAPDTPPTFLAVTNNMKFAICSEGDNTVRIWSMAKCEEERRSVSHAERVTCCALTVDGLHLVTGSEDMSLKVWQLDGGKLSQVLVGHSDVVTCVAVSVLNKTQVVSGAWDCNLIVWDITTGADLHLLSGHLGKVMCVKVTGDGTIAVSGGDRGVLNKVDFSENMIVSELKTSRINFVGVPFNAGGPTERCIRRLHGKNPKSSEDKTLIIWETKRGLALTSLALHVPLVTFQITSDCSRIVVHLFDRGCLPIICLHNTPAVYVKVPTYAAPTKDIDELRPLAPKRPMRRLLKKEVSLDTYTWQKKYGHLTSAAMMAQVDERLKRRFSVSASMEEISKIQQEKNKDLGSLASLGPEQAALAQSQHFDQLEALWNKISPPRRRSNKSLTKQSSLIESRFDSSDEEHTPVDEQEHMVD